MIPVAPPVPLATHQWHPSPPQAVLPPLAPPSIWHSDQLHHRLKNLRETVHLLKAVKAELEAILRMNGLSDEENEPRLRSLSEAIRAKKIDPKVQEFLSLEAANSLMSSLESQIAPFKAVLTENGGAPWEERSAAVGLAQKMMKSRRNLKWRRKKRRRVADMLRQERERYEQADHDADEWRAREIAKDIARRKVENMKNIAKLKVNEEKRRLESELELVLMVEKLQELRSMRIQKLKNQGHFLPEEDDKFLDRVRAAVEEEEREAAAAADTHAAKDAISIAEESRKAIQGTVPDTNYVKKNNNESKGSEDLSGVMEDKSGPVLVASVHPEQRDSERQGSGGGYDPVSNLPYEFYHYFHGSSTDMGTLIEVRRMWDAYIRPGGSQIPGHWVQPPPPANQVWASYLVRPK
ncbi:hypothetical protein QJS10_CPB22g00030 [Acorus calamus]|uniref:Uncharacterized protein n=1 Tax=Acorus calamus TaxID=4465 RepID=A0AAV9BZC2_ACOCL|nr:hypothetical protein QJS10_CPB22g00030 [Acorus calamus]